MTIVTTIILMIVIGLFVARLISKKSTANSSFDKLVATPLTISNRLLYYILLGGLSITTPYILTMIFIIATGDRYDGMRLGVIPGIVTVHIAFGLIFIKKKLVQKIFLTVVVTTIAFILVWLGMANKIITTGWDLYQFWDLAITNFLAGLILWETFFQVNHRLTNPKNSRAGISSHNDYLRERET